jgi:hypothetical protein
VFALRHDGQVSARRQQDNKPLRGMGDGGKVKRQTDVRQARLMWCCPRPPEACYISRR